MKKLAVFSLLAIFIFNSVGYYIVFKVSQSEAKEEIQSNIKLGLPVQKLTEITFDKNAVGKIQWTEKNKEFYYNNKLYDIVKSSDSKNTIVFYCISDEKEETLFADLDEHIKVQLVSNDSKSNSTSKKLSNHVVKIYFNHSSEICFYSNGINYLFSIPKINYLSALTETNSPPPELV
ncbi:MAG: hypothetical protein NTX97_05340 [Bacteroidetes bacterium]|nr:hypothetical protein [Bacteroidota bacterium]